ncbi:hypothetical protein O1D97_18215 [Marinomonas sp. 15G1-11]|uniref:Uncharacterized protein n=1 Tax=Marinomonas phaeophyticola TaxID=3004091 RepID=A0ABT4K132_9GAMM|nr:hypothetical protein [Marinomonas sp. 15G1-11]MCZ2723494.1 hypothetical protein [Marinomonas sp. 15G1-11]
MVSIRRKKKAISKVVKLLNLATSSNSSESKMALRHAESVIHQNALKKYEIPQSMLCDVNTLFRVNWSLPSRAFSTESEPQKPKVTESFSTRRFSEKPVDTNRSYANSKTILDDYCEANESKDKGVDDKATFGSDLNATADRSTDFKPNTKKSQENVSTMNYAADNVINAANAFRPDAVAFTDRLRGQYASSNPDMPFEEDKYWNKIYTQLADFNEADVQSKLDALALQQKLAEESLKEKRNERLLTEQEEQAERSERAKIERSFEEAIEKAFQLRAQSYEAWEKRRSDIRMHCLREERDALAGFEELVEDYNKITSDYQRHIQLKEEYRAAKIMHELRKQLSNAVKQGEEGRTSFDSVIDIMASNDLSLRDLEFSDIKSKSLFIKLLERETAKIDDIDARENYTDDMLTKFLTSTVGVKAQQKVVNPLLKIEELLASASVSSQFEAQKSLDQIFHLMSSNGISIKDVNLAVISKYSVFVRLLNWEAEQIVSITERERFTAGVLENYVALSIDAGDAKKPAAKKTV